MIHRFLRSRASRKFRRNRLAMVGLAVIVVYALIGLVALVTDGIDMLGRKLGTFDIDPNTTIGFLTLESAEQVIAPGQVSGFHKRQMPEKQLRDDLFYVSTYKKNLVAAERAAKRRLRADPSLTQADLDHRTVETLRAVTFGERRMKDASLTEIRAILARADALADQLEASEDLDADPSLAPKLAELDKVVDELFEPLEGLTAARYEARMMLGTDRQGRSILVRGLVAVKVAFQVGFVVATISVVLGSLIGAAAAFYGGWVDHAVVWLYSTLSSVPDLVLLAVLVFMFTGSIFDDVSKPYLSLVPLYAAMSLTFWIGPCRVIRGETLKIKQLEYVQAATSIGFGRFYILLKHVLPNTVHLMFINFSLLFIAAIKNEVVLSFLGLGVKVGPSWGRMIADAGSEVITQIFWQMGAATVLMFGLVLAFNVVSDAMQDAFDPKHVG